MSRRNTRLLPLIGPLAICCAAHALHQTATSQSGVRASGQAGGGASSATFISAAGSGTAGGSAAQSEGVTEQTSRTSIVENDLKVDVVNTSRRTRDAQGNVLVDNQREISVQLGGQNVPKERVREFEDRIEILDERGAVLREVALPRVLSLSQTGGAEDVVALALRNATGQERLARTMVMRPRALLGVTLEGADPALARQLKLPGDALAVVAGVVPGGPAAKAGVQPFDVVVAVDGQRPASPQRIREVLGAKEAGQVLRLTLAEGASTREIEVTLGLADSSAPSSGFTWDIAASPSGTFEFQLNKEILAALEAMEGQFEGLDADRLNMLLAPMIAPTTPPATPGAPSAPSLRSLYRFAVPGGAAGPGTASEPLAAAERIQRLEATIERLEETIRRLEARMAAPPTPPAARPARGTPPT